MPGALVFTSADADYFISHVDLTRVAEYRAEATKLTGEASIASLFRHLSASRLVTIAQIDGRVRGAGSEFVLACDMRFAARETAIFGQIEPAFGLIPGGGATQYLVRVMGRARALEVLFSADDYDAELAERYGWINRALPADNLKSFVTRLAHRIAAFPAAGQVAVKERVNALSLAPAEDFRRDSDLFGDGVRNPGTQRLIKAAFKRGLQTPDGEMALASMLAGLGPPLTRCVVRTAGRTSNAAGTTMTSIRSTISSRFATVVAELVLIRRLVEVTRQELGLAVDEVRPGSKPHESDRCRC